MTRFLEITNLVTGVDLESIDDFSELKEEFREELQKYGTVRDIVICPKGTSREGKVYVEYESKEEVALHRAGQE